MSILRVTPEQAHTITVASAEQVEGKFGPQVQFTTPEGDIVFVSLSSAERQLQRLGVDLETVKGETLTISQVRKDSKTFTNIDRANGKPKTQATNAHNTHGAPGWLDDQEADERNFVEKVKAAPTDKLQTLMQLYTVCLDQAVVLAKRHSLPADSAHAMASTMFIQASKAGLAA